MNKTFGRCIAIFLLACAGAAWGAETREQTYVVGADVNSQGQVTQTQVDADVNQSIANVLDLALKHWQFAPTSSADKPANVHTFIKVKLEMIPAEAGKHTLQVSYLKHGPKWDSRPPEYPAQAIRQHDAGTVVVLGSMNKDGRFDISDTRIVLANGHRQSTLKLAADKWLTSGHAVPETVNGQPVAADAHVAINFRMSPLNGGLTCPTCTTYNKEEQQLLRDTGFKPPFDAESVDAQSLSSVLQTRIINPVTMQL